MSTLNQITLAMVVFTFGIVGFDPLRKFWRSVVGLICLPIKRRPRCTCDRPPKVMHIIGCPVVTPPNSCEACGVIRNANGICWWCDG